MIERDLTTIDTWVIHCSATKPSQDIGVDEIRRWHLDKGWDDIGYHFVIRRDGAVEVGRDLKYVGAHARGANRTSIGVCLIGGIDEDGKPDANYTASQIFALDSLVKFGLGDSCHVMKGLEDFSIRRAKGIKVIGHRDVPGTNKACPCFDVKAFFGRS